MEAASETATDTPAFTAKAALSFLAVFSGLACVAIIIFGFLIETPRAQWDAHRQSELHAVAALRAAVSPWQSSGRFPSADQVIVSLQQRGYAAVVGTRAAGERLRDTLVVNGTTERLSVYRRLSSSAFSRSMIGLTLLGEGRTVTYGVDPISARPPKYDRFNVISLLVAAGLFALSLCSLGVVVLVGRRRAAA